MRTSMIRNSTLGLRQQKRKILVVEDNEFNREMLVSLLADDFDLIEAENGLEGLEILEETYQDLSLILLDVYMPVCDGFEFLRRKGQQDRFNGVPVIVTTAGGSVEEEIACLELGANDFVVKPYNFEILMNRVTNLIHLKESVVIVNELRWDQVTGLLTKEFFYREVTYELAANPDTPYDLIVSDISGFKSLNDRYGEVQCDNILATLAHNLRVNVEGQMISGRIGTDTFAFMVQHTERTATEWEEALIEAEGELPVPRLNVKFGVVCDIDHTMVPRMLCHRAQSALETIKGKYGRNVALFDDEIHRQQLLEQTIRDTMEAAIEEMQFSVFFQPKIDVHRDCVGGAEALVRWFHPTVGFISPGFFIPIFEKSGFIGKLDLYVWEEACREIKRLEKQGLPVVPISVNASRLDFNVEDLPGVYAGIADRYGVDHRLLHIEVTETVYTDNPEVVDILRGFKQLGFSCELDDFGSGYSSLASLSTLPIDVMKLDMSMIRRATETGDFRIVESTINLAQVLGLTTVVEGVELREEARRVTEIGCDYIQGYYYSKPLSRDEFEAYMANEKQSGRV